MHKDVECKAAGGEVVSYKAISNKWQIQLALKKTLK
jgi:hypothetical protein